MTNLLTIAYYEIKRLLRDPKLLAIIFSQPIIISVAAVLIFYRAPEGIKIGIVDKNPNQYSNELISRLENDKTFQVARYEAIQSEEVKTNKLRGFLEINISPERQNSYVKYYNDPTGKVLDAYAAEKLSQILPEVARKLSQDNIRISIDSKINELQKSFPVALPRIEIESSTIRGIETSSENLTPFQLHYYDFYTSAVMILMIILVILNLSGISLTSERINGTFERLFVTPYSKSQVIFGKAVAQFAVGVIVAAIGLLTLKVLFSISLGSLALVILINALTVAMAVALGLLISSVTSTVVESVQLAMYLFFISVLTTGMIAPFETAWKYLPYIIKINPFYYAVDASRRVGMLNASFSEIATNVYILIGFLVLSFFLAVGLLKREAK